MSLQFIIGGSGSGKTRTLYENLIRQSMEEPDGRFFALVPEQFTMQTQKEIVMLHPNHGVMNIDIVSFERLAYRVFEELAIENLAVLDDMGKSMVLRRVSSGVRGNLHLFGGHLDKAGFISEIKSMLSEFFQYGITEEKLETLIGETKSPLLRQKLLDMQVLYRAFQAYTEEKVIVKEEILSLLCRVLPQSQLIRDSVVTLDGYTGFTPIQYELLELLFRCCRKVIVTVTMDPEDNPYRESVQQKLFYMSRHTVCRLIDRAAAAGCSRDEDILLKEKPMWRFKDSPELGFIENELFRYRGKVYHSGSGNESGATAEHGRESLRLIEAATPQAEISFLCGEIRRLVASEGIRYREIAVITGDLETYSREILRQFEKNQIPCFIDYKKNILSNPMVELIRAALEVLQSGFSYESVFRFLKTGLVMPLAGLSPEVIYQAENYVIALGIRGFKRWNSTWERVYRGAELINLDELNQFREAVVTPFLPFREVFSNRKATVRERTEALVHFLEALEMEQKLAAMAQQFEEVGDMSLAKEYGQVYGLVMDLFDRIVALLGEEVMGQREYAEILDAGFAEIKVGLIPAVVDRIVVGDITRTRLSNIKVLFFAGVNDGIVPSVSGRGGILSEADRRALREMQVELAPPAREESFLQRFYLLLELGMSWVLRGLQDEKSGENDQFISLYRYFIQAESYRDEMQALSDAAFYTYQDTGIGKAAARALYSPILRGSVTRMELYASCAYAHFLSYGLELSERQMYEIAPSDIGNLFHAAIDMYFTRMKEENRLFSGISEEDRQKMVAECVASVTEEYGNAILGSSYRNQYLERKVYRDHGSDDLGTDGTAKKR